MDAHDGGSGDGPSRRRRQKTMANGEWLTSEDDDWEKLKATRNPRLLTENCGASRRCEDNSTGRSMGEESVRVFGRKYRYIFLGLWF